MASGALGVLEAHGLAVPGEVAVTTVDENYFAVNASTPLTTINIHTADKGAVMVETFLELIEGNRVPVNTTIPSTLIERASVRS